MKIIDLLNKIANGEEVPMFKYYGGVYKYDNDTGQYWCGGMWFDFNSLKNINDEVEILEEPKVIPKRINNGYTKQSIVDMKEARFNSNDMAKICNRIGWLMQNRNELSNKIDEIIDYLESKGESNE